MRLRIALSVGIVTVVAMTASAAFSAPFALVTGGGQTDVGDRGAGDTIAFTARGIGDGDDAQGQVQYVDREGGTGQGQVVLHGIVECLVVDGNTAMIGGRWQQTESPFEVYVQDNGEGNNNTDLVAVSDVSNPDCLEDDENDDPTALARGNAQVHDEN